MLPNKGRGVSHRRSVFSKKDFYFVFGQIHKTVDGVPMRDRQVRVRAKNEVLATEIFKEEFTSKYMPSVECWSRAITRFYTDHREMKEIFPHGEYMAFEQKDAL